MLLLASKERHGYVFAASTSPELGQLNLEACLMSGEESLLEAAIAVRKNAHAPYSGFMVGAALQTDIGVFVGCNVENISFGLTLCAERAAIAAAVASGAKRLITLMVVTDSEQPCVPCGACRQVLAEFKTDLRIVSATSDGKTQEFTLSRLLPHANQGLLEANA
jgi:cytidine deaminase